MTFTRQICSPPKIGPSSLHIEVVQNNSMYTHQIFSSAGATFKPCTITCFIGYSLSNIAPLESYFNYFQGCFTKLIQDLFCPTSYVTVNQCITAVLASHTDVPVSQHYSLASSRGLTSVRPISIIKCQDLTNTSNSSYSLWYATSAIKLNVVTVSFKNL